MQPSSASGIAIAQTERTELSKRRRRSRQPTWLWWLVVVTSTPAWGVMLWDIMMGESHGLLTDAAAATLIIVGIVEIAYFVLAGRRSTRRSGA